MWPPLNGVAPMNLNPFAQYDFCDVVTFTLAGMAFALSLYIGLGV